MNTEVRKFPYPSNEPVLSYEPGSKEREALQKELERLRTLVTDIPMVIGGKRIQTDKKIKVSPPHDHKHTLGYFHEGDKSHVTAGINSALQAHEEWAKTSWENRAAIFLKAAELISGKYRALMNASTMLGQSKNAYQAEIDSACELIDFFRFNVEYLQQIYSIQPTSPEGITNQMEYRPLEGFVFALTPFNFTAIAGNLPAAPALMGNTVVWKPAFSQVYSAHFLMNILEEAGLPAGVINLVLTDGPEAGEVIFDHPYFAGLHFTGSTKVFQMIWKTISNNLEKFRNFPRIVGETGGKDFVVAHPSADAKEIVTALIRGAFEFQGQKCSAASRAYIPSNLWEDVKQGMVSEMKKLKMGTVEDFSNFINAVIDERAFDKITGYIEHAKKDPQLKIIAGGNYDKSKGYFIEPTLILSEIPETKLMCEEIFGPVLTIYVYDENHYDNILKIIDKTSPYALTGAVFSKDTEAIEKAKYILRNAAGNFYINDKPTGAVVNQQPFGGARHSGTNDKAGSVLNLLRWVSPRTIKINHNPPVDWKYAFLG